MNIILYFCTRQLVYIKKQLAHLATKLDTGFLMTFGKRMML